MMFVLVARFDLVPGTEGDFDELVAETRAAIERDEPDTLIYLTHEVNGEPAARVFYEVYRDRTAFDVHEQNAHTRHFLEQRERYLAAAPRVEVLGSARGKGVGWSSPR
jgi:quinol monooxygenase YgiN